MIREDIKPWKKASQKYYQDRRLLRTRLSWKYFCWWRLSKITLYLAQVINFWKEQGSNSKTCFIALRASQFTRRTQWRSKSLYAMGPLISKESESFKITTFKNNTGKEVFNRGQGTLNFISDLSSLKRQFFRTEKRRVWSLMNNARSSSQTRYINYGS